jgi:hypothetical protein
MRLKKVLIISPYFPPSNAADMQRIRMSLPYFNLFAWDAQVVTVDEKQSEMLKDDLLLRSIPAGIKIHQVTAYSRKWTSVFGLGSLALRSLWFYRKKVNQLLKEEHFDLIYFSTTQFPVCILGAYWKKRFNIPYVIDMQDPWHSEYYKKKSKKQRPPKYWFSYRLNKYLEPIAMSSVDGLISVSADYITDLKKRYPIIEDITQAIITFGAFQLDIKIAEDNKQIFKPLLDPQFINIVYIGRGGVDMHNSISVLFQSFKEGLDKYPDLFGKIKLNFIGTSYAPSGQGKPTILPLARKFHIEGNIIEVTDRISYYHTLATLGQADALFMPGSDDHRYTASKIYPYLLTQKPLLAIFNSRSPAHAVLRSYGVKYAFSYDSKESNSSEILKFLTLVANKTLSECDYETAAVEKYSAKNMAKAQCDLFDAVLNKKKANRQLK